MAVSCILESGCYSYSSLYYFIFLSLQFSNIKNFVTLFSGTVRPRRLKLCTHVDSGQMYRVYRNQAAAAYLSLYSFFFLSNFQTLKVFVTLFSDEFFVTLFSAGWLGCAMLLGSFHCRGILLLLHIVGQGPAVLAAGAGWVGYSFYIF